VAHRDRPARYGEHLVVLLLLCPATSKGVPLRCGDAGGRTRERRLNQHVEERLGVHRLVLEGHEQHAPDMARERHGAVLDLIVDTSNARPHTVSEFEHLGACRPVGLAGRDLGVRMDLGGVIDIGVDTALEDVLHVSV
jgi:hypothetical protein